MILFVALQYFDPVTVVLCLAALSIVALLVDQFNRRANATES